MIYIIANANATSGGPELLHQLCFVLTENGFEATMLYFSRYKFGTNKVSDAIKDRYGKYECAVSTKIVDEPGNTVIIPETMTFFLPKIKRAKRVIWWQSVDNFFWSLTSPYAKLYAPLGMQRKKFDPFQEDIFHCFQSEYAKIFLLEKGVNEAKLFSLSDFINEDIISYAEEENKNSKNDAVIFNPRKGFEYTTKIMEKMPDIKWIPLQGYSPSEMADIMAHSKVYIDFGNHPGKDRIPREAVICGCCIIVGKRGSAENNVDIPIADKYKIGMSEFDEDMIISRITECLNNYDSVRKDFDKYREHVLEEKTVFIREVKEFGNAFQ